MILRIFFISFLVILGDSLNIWSQTPPSSSPTIEALPPGDIIPHLDFAHWVLTISRNADNSSIPKQGSTGVILQTIEVTKTKNVRFLKSTVGQSGTDLGWCIGNMEYVQSNNAWRFFGTTSTSLPDYSLVDFPDCTWMTRTNYTRVTKVNDKKYYFFKDVILTVSKEELEQYKQEAVSTGKSFDIESYKTPVFAYLDYETHLPVYIMDNTRVLSYKFLEPQNTILTPPPALMKVINMINNRMKIAH